MFLFDWPPSHRHRQTPRPPFLLAMSFNVEPSITRVDVDANFLPYPATRLVLVQYCSRLPGPGYWGAIAVGTFYDEHDNVICRHEAFIGYLDLVRRPSSGGDSQMREFSRHPLSRLWHTRHERPILTHGLAYHRNCPSRGLYMAPGPPGSPIWSFCASNLNSHSSAKQPGQRILCLCL